MIINISRVSDKFQEYQILKILKTSGVEDNGTSANEFVLFQNYPNPFNPSTNIQYQISSLSQVSLKIYDVLGNEVATLVNEEKTAGSYEVEFNKADPPPAEMLSTYRVEYISTSLQAGFICGNKENDSDEINSP